MIARCLLLLLVLACSVSLSSAQPAAETGPDYTEPLGIALEGVEYPYPVQYYSFILEGQLVRMAYMVVEPAGTPLGRDVVLLHGKNFYGGYWGGPAQALSRAGFRVIIPDQIGFGKSSKPDVNYSFDLLAETTAKLLDQLGASKVSVVGHSMGGMLAVRFARTFPERTTHLVLEDPIGLEDYRMSIPPQPLSVLMEDEMTMTSADKIRTFYKNYVVKWDPSVFEPFVETRTRVTLSGEYPRWAKASARTYQMIYREPVRYEFTALRVPTLLVIGLQDRTVVGKKYAPAGLAAKLGDYAELGKAAARDIPGSELLEIPNVGHIPHLEAPQSFDDALVRFLQK
ncbi:alpha/beta hydrolase [Opitutaceae bacterium EW11]|nr:alpha/beta hydrolase [Opitutaceae bacterium EW11]